MEYMLKSLKYNALWILSAAMVFSSMIQAETEGPEPHPQQKKAANQPQTKSSKSRNRLFRPTISYQNVYINDSGIDGNEGELASTVHKLTVFNQLFLFGYEYWDINWKDVSELPFGDQKTDPITEMQRFNLFGQYGFKLNAENRLLIAAGLESVFEKETNESYSGQVLGMVRNKISAQHTLTFGGFYRYHKVRSRFLPSVGWSYRERQPLGLSSTVGFPRTRLNYGFDKHWSVLGTFQYDQFLGKLAKDSVIAADGYAEFETYKLNLDGVYAFNKHLKLQLGAFIAPEYRFIVYDAEESRDDSYRVTPTWGTRLKISYQF